MLAAVTFAASPSPSAAPENLHTIVTEKSTPYCTALGRHFNAALAPVSANDRTFDGAAVQLDRLDDLFSGPNYQQQFDRVRVRLIAEVDVVLKSLPEIQNEIDALRGAERLTADPHAAGGTADAVAALQRTYDEQRRLAIDLQGLAQTMMSYDLSSADHPIGGDTWQTRAMPHDMKDIRAFLRFDARREAIAASEADAVNAAYTVATTFCSL